MSPGDEWWAARLAAAQCDDLGQALRRTSPAWRGAAADSYLNRCADASARGARSVHCLLGAAEAWADYDRIREQARASPDSTAAAVLLAQADSRLVARLEGLGPGSWSSPGDDPAPGDPAREAWRRLPKGAEPEEVARWWESLTSHEHEALLIALPGVIGGLAGLPAWVRDRANRLVLDRDLVALGWKGRTLSPAQRHTLRLARSVDESLAAHPGSLLYGYDPGAFEGDGGVSVWTDDPRNAEHLAVLVPGFTTDAGDLERVLERAEWIDDAAEASGDDVAVLAWLGYDAPDNLWGDADALEVLTATAADDGGSLLADLVDGLRAGDDPEQLTVIGHSYGSTTAALAAAHHGLAADDLVLVGSPGAGPGVQTADDLGVPDGHVWVGANSRDPVVHLGDHGWWGSGSLGAGLGHDPAADEFGSIRFHAESSPGDVRGPIAVHGSYFDPGSESLTNIGAIVSGHPEHVGHAEGVRDPWWGAPRDPEARRRRT